MNNYFKTVLVGLLTLSISMTAHADEIKQDTTERSIARLSRKTQPMPK
mgnify:CR=1 FL=1